MPLTQDRQLMQIILTYILQFNTEYIPTYEH